MCHVRSCHSNTLRAGRSGCCGYQSKQARSWLWHCWLCWLSDPLLISHAVILFYYRPWDLGASSFPRHEPLGSKVIMERHCPDAFLISSSSCCCCCCCYCCGCMFDSPKLASRARGKTSVLGINIITHTHAVIPRMHELTVLVMLDRRCATMVRYDGFFDFHTYIDMLVVTIL